MTRIIFLVFIIAIFPLSVTAHAGEDHAGVLPGEFGYMFERVGEWIEVNLLTVSTKAKQQKYLAYADERLAEMATLLEIAPNRESALKEALKRYQSQLRRSREMAEVIIFLDGAELDLAKAFERKTFEHEKLLAQLPATGIVSEALITARIENKNIFAFMVEKYQQDEASIREYADIVRRHIGLLEESDDPKIQGLIAEARDHLDAGLNLRASELVEEAKNLLYANLPQ